ncbi:hypothetical protein D9613_008978 [Agrocybe pediades]|uniref:HMG box domain-containing protein n=1 Tax=Agrocybe pediades TaxID=84607 RepID=A0A8H4VTV4_9AGAR|nr:hypothetical protein D9613_008978 [Agrocybe pediades]
MASHNNFDLYIQRSNYTQDFGDMFSGAYHETHLHGGSVSLPIQTRGSDGHMVQTTTPYATVSFPAQPNNHAYPFPSPTQPPFPFPAVYPEVGESRGTRSMNHQMHQNFPARRLHQTPPLLTLLQGSSLFRTIIQAGQATPFLRSVEELFYFNCLILVRLVVHTRSRRRRDPEHIPRPRNAFIFFRSYFIDHLLPPATSSGQQHEISKLAGQAWRKLSKAEREPFVQRAKLERMEHKTRYPDSVYASGRAARRGSESSVAASPTPSMFPSPDIGSPFAFPPSWNLEPALHPVSQFTESQLHIPERNGFSANFIPDNDLIFSTALSSGSEPWLQPFD